jgi:hypothetical protein
MARIVRLTESELTRLVRRVIKEQNECTFNGKTFKYYYLIEKNKPAEGSVVVMGEPKKSTSGNYNGLWELTVSEGNQKFSVYYNCNTNIMYSNKPGLDKTYFQGKITLTEMQELLYQCKCNQQ